MTDYVVLREMIARLMLCGNRENTKTTAKHLQFWAKIVFPYYTWLKWSNCFCILLSFQSWANIVPWRHSMPHALMVVSSWCSRLVMEECVWDDVSPLTTWLDVMPMSCRMLMPSVQDITSVRSLYWTPSLSSSSPAVKIWWLILRHPTLAYLVSRDSKKTSILQKKYQ